MPRTEPMISPPYIGIRCGSVVLTAQKNASQNAENEAVTISHGYHLPSEHQKSVKDKQTPAAGAAEQVVSGHYNASHYITAFHIGM